MSRIRVVALLVLIAGLIVWAGWSLLAPHDASMPIRLTYSAPATENPITPIPDTINLDKTRLNSVVACSMKSVSPAITAFLALLAMI
jgi:hypothetical protein